MDLIVYENDILQEKQRSAKFNENELNLLNGLIRKYKHVILNKKTGQVTPKQKEEAWETITVEFNSDPACTLRRTTTQLKNKWDYMKRNAKKDVTAYKKAHRQTGGGKGPAPLDDTTAILLDTVRESVEGVPSTFDCDKTISSKIFVLENETNEIISTSATVAIPEEEPFENLNKAGYNYEQPISLTPNTNDKIGTASIKDQSDFKVNSSQIKKRKLHMNDVPVVKSTPQYTRAKFVEVAEKKIQCLDYKEIIRDKKTSIEIEILEKKSENASLERKKLELECNAQNLDIEIKHLIKKKIELALALLENQYNKHNKE